jgi:uncharacterized membrane protein
MLRRLLRHLFTDHWSVRRRFPPAAIAAFERAVARGELTHGGQVRLAIEAALPIARVLQGMTPSRRARELFAQLGVWDTEANCGVLIYLLLADRHVEIVADRGIHARVGAAAWREICARMETAFRAGDFAAGVERGLDDVAALLAPHFPPQPGQGNELSDKPVIL